MKIIRTHNYECLIYQKFNEHNPDTMTILNSWLIDFSKRYLVAFKLKTLLVTQKYVTLNFSLHLDIHKSKTHRLFKHNNKKIKNGW